MSNSVKTSPGNYEDRITELLSSAQLPKDLQALLSDIQIRVKRMTPEGAMVFMRVLEDAVNVIITRRGTFQQRLYGVLFGHFQTGSSPTYVKSGDKLGNKFPTSAANDPQFNQEMTA